jgi:hypothetical protein
MDQRDQGNENSTISGFHKAGREGVRPEAYPFLWWRGCTQFDLEA